MRIADNSPLITLQPALNSGNVWAALLLAGERPLDGALLARVLNDGGLAEVLDAVVCIALVDPAQTDSALLETWPAGRVELRYAAPESVDTAWQELVAALSAAGLKLAPELSVTASKSDPTTRGLLLRLLALVTRDAESSDLEALIKRDPNLSYQLLKLVNSVAYSPIRKISNFSQAIVMLGRRQLQRWLQLLLYARSSGSQTASPLLPRAALRASLMESLAKRRGLAQDARDQAFMVGMFSLLEVLFDVPLAEIVAPLNLPEEVVQALTDGAGPFGALLAVVVASEGPPTPALSAALDAVGITRAAWLDALIEATRWAVQVSREA